MKIFSATQLTLVLAAALVSTGLSFFAPVLAQTKLAYADSVSEGLNQLKQDAGDALPDTVIDENSKPSDLFAKILNFGLGIAFVVAVIMVMYGGYQYITSAGNEEQATNGRKTLIYALIGMVIVIMSFVIVNAVVRFVTNNS